MDLTYINSKDLKSLEDYLISLVMALISIKSFNEYHLQAMKVGILDDELHTRAATIIWDFQRISSHYNEQIKSICDLLPSDINLESILKEFQQKELKNARKLIKESKTKKEDP
jgi:demethoxyubiquinone hydroxylase (CLK1/Coq7/Cat5 family)